MATTQLEKDQISPRLQEFQLALWLWIGLQVEDFPLGQMVSFLWRLCFRKDSYCVASY
jgi:hypothetical protein